MITANADAQLRLVVSAVDKSSAAFAAIVANAHKTAQEIQKALSGAMSGTGGSGGVNVNNKVWSQVAQGVQDVHGNLVQANGQLNAFNGNIEKLVINAPKHGHELDKMFALTLLDQALGKLRQFGETITQFIAGGMEDARDKSASIASFVQGALVNAPAIRAAGKEAMDIFAKEISANANKIAIRIGLDTTFSDNQVAQGLAILARSGVSVEDIFNGVGDSMAKIAMIGDTDIPTAARHMITLFNQFGPQLKQAFGGDTVAAMEHVADVITNSLSASGTNLNEFMTALSYSGTISALAGQSFENTATVLALFAKNGIYGSKAGTGLRRIITNLTPSTEKAEEAIKRLTATIGGNADIFYDASGKMKPLTEVQALLYEQMKDKSPQEQVFLMKEIFGQYAVGQALVLATSNEFGNLADKIHQAGTAQEYIDRIMGSSKGVQDRYEEAIKSLQETMGTFVNQALDPFKTKLADLVERYLTKAPEETQKFVTELLGGVGVVLQLAGVVGSAVIGFKLLTAALAAAKISMGVVVSTIGTVLLVIAAVAAAAYLLWKAWDTNFLGIRDVTKAVFGEVLKFATQVADWLTAWWNDLAPTATQAWANVKEAFEYAWTLIEPIVVLFSEQLVGVIKAAWNGIKDIVAGALKILGGVITFVMGVIAGDWGKAWDGIKQTFDGFWTAFKAVWDMTMGVLWALLEPILKGIVEGFGGSWDEVEKRFESFKTTFSTLWSGFTSFFSNLPSQMWSWATNAVDMFIGGINSKIEAVKSVASKITGAIGDFLGFHSPTKLGPGAEADEWMPNMMTMFIDGIEAKREALRRAVAGVALDLSVGVGGTPSAVAMGGVGGVGGGKTIIINYYGTGNRKDDDYVINQIQRVVAMPT